MYRYTIILTTNHRLSLGKRKLTLLASALLVVAFASASPRHGYVNGTNTKVILHAWLWDFNTIAKNMKLIDDAGYDFVQTSPANTCFIGEGGKALYSQPGDSITGKWYYYQPTDWEIGNYMLGTRDEFKAMCDSTMKYNVRVLVDVLPNHTAVDHTAVLPDLDRAVDGAKTFSTPTASTPSRSGTTAMNVHRRNGRSPRRQHRESRLSIQTTCSMSTTRSTLARVDSATIQPNTSVCPPIPAIPRTSATTSGPWQPDAKPPKDCRC